MRGEKKKKRTERERERKNYSQVYQKSVCAKEWGPHCCDGPREGPDGFFFRLRFVFFLCFVLFFYFLFFVQIEDPKQHLCRARSCYRLLLSSLINEPVQGKPSKLYPPPLFTFWFFFFGSGHFLAQVSTYSFSLLRPLFPLALRHSFSRKK